MTPWDPTLTPSFSVDEMRCKHTGRVDMDGDFMVMLQALRDRVGAIKVNSGFRAPEHPIEAAKDSPGAHAYGLAADIRPLESGMYETLKAAFEIGFVGIAFEGEFIHVDAGHPHKHRPASWSY